MLRSSVGLQGCYGADVDVIAWATGSGWAGVGALVH
jgi:hypothetical protein